MCTLRRSLNNIFENTKLAKNVYFFFKKNQPKMPVQIKSNEEYQWIVAFIKLEGLDVNGISRRIID